MSVSGIASALLIEGGKQVIRKVVRGRRMSFCPHCGGKVFIRRKSKGKR